VRDCSREPADDGALLGLMKLHLELTRATQFRCHLVERSRERSHFVDAICRNLHVEIAAGHLPRRS